MLATLRLFVIGALLVGCGGGGGGGGGVPPPPDVDVTGHWGGTWASTSSPGSGGAVDATLVQTGHTVTGTFIYSGGGCCAGGSVGGHVNGDQASLVVTACGFNMAVTLTMPDPGIGEMDGFYVVGQGAGQCSGDEGQVSIHIVE